MGPVFPDCVALVSLRGCSLREILGDLVSRGQGQEQDLDCGHVWSSFPVLMQLLGWQGLLSPCSDRLGGTRAVSRWIPCRLALWGGGGLCGNGSQELQCPIRGGGGTQCSPSPSLDQGFKYSRSWGARAAARPSPCSLFRAADTPPAGTSDFYWDPDPKPLTQPIHIPQVSQGGGRAEPGAGCEWSLNIWASVSPRRRKATAVSPAHHLGETWRAAGGGYAFLPATNGWQNLPGPRVPAAGTEKGGLVCPIPCPRSRGRVSPSKPACFAPWAGPWPYWPRSGR